MMDLVNFKNSISKYDELIDNAKLEMDYRIIELTGKHSGSLERRLSDADVETLSRDVIYNYLKYYRDILISHKGFIETYGMDLCDAEQMHHEWAKKKIVKEDEE